MSDAEEFLGKEEIEEILGPPVEVVRIAKEGNNITRETMPALCAVDAVLDDPDNGKVWQSAHIYTYDLVDLGLWDRSP